MNLNFLLNLIFPTKCLGCEKTLDSDDVLCFECRQSIPLNKTLYCGKCSARIPENKKICHLGHPYILGAVLPYHEPIVKKLIRGLKFKRDKRIAGALAKYLADYAKYVALDFSEYNIIPLPLSRERLRERGFNQAELISEEFSKIVKTPLLTDCLARIKDAKPQSEVKGHHNRLDNVRDAFLADTSRVTGKNVIILDDVTTSGATFYEASLALKAAGAKKIIALAVAKA